jgi:hypothetical protein
VFCCTVDHVEVAIVPACLDSLLIGLYVLADEFFIDRRGPGRPRKITDAELVCLAVAQVLLDCPGDRKFLAWARWRLGHLFPYLPKQPGYNKRIRALAPQVARLLNLLIFESTSIHDELWLIDGTPIACGQSRQTSRRSELAGYAAYGYCKSQHRHYWGFKLALVCAPDGMPIGFELVAADVDERKAAAEILERIPAAGHIILADEGGRPAWCGPPVSLVGVGWCLGDAALDLAGLGGGVGAGVALAGVGFVVAAVQRIVVLVAAQDVDACAAEQPVVAAVAAQLVVARAAGERVVAAAAGDGVIPRAGADDVVVGRR